MRLISAVLMLLVLLSGASFAASESKNLPLGMTQQQVDALGDAISLSVIKKLKEEGLIGNAKPETATRAGASEPDQVGEDKIAVFVAKAGRVLSSYPALLRELARIPEAFDKSESGGRGLWRYLLMLVTASGAAASAEVVFRRAFRGARQRLENSIGVSEGWSAILPLTGLLATDAIAVAAVGIVGYGMMGIWFSGGDNQAMFARAVLKGIFAWRLYMFAFRVVLRPDLKGARLAATDDAGAVAVFDRLSAVVAAILFLHTIPLILRSLQAPNEAIAAAQILGNVIIFGLLVWAAWASREPMATWFADLGRVDGRHSIGQCLGRHWFALALPFFLLLLVAQIYGAIDLRSTIPAAMVLTLNVIVGLIFLKTLIAYLLRLHRRRRPAGTELEKLAASAPAPEPFVSDVVARCIFLAAILGAIALVAESWIVNVLALVNADDWRSLTRASLTAASTLFAAYVAWEFVKFAALRYGARPPPAPGAATGEDQNVAGSASRLATLMPLLRIGLAITIFALAGLIVLSDLGVNITPLIAAASVFGLAISFGSQTLVRDIVSGIFYLADDAFRVGDYIDCGKAKGAVEGFTLRSIRLRHQNGQVHTIPFGQLGQITNFNRDWTGVKFNLRVARNTDLEKLRKTVKKIGEEMLEDPELKGEILEPLKMQGIADIADNAIIVRFKFTVKPGKPTLVQHQAISRMMAAFGLAGIEFA
jgi:moderate conductance mechanosensitive channel